ncbi:hypothetical protein GCM10023403_42800 [Pseudonocardia benzenivorans]
MRRREARRARSKPARPRLGARAARGTVDAGEGGPAVRSGPRPAVSPYLARIAAAGDHPHSTAWAADPDRLGAPPQTFEAILDWLLDGLETLS